MADDDRERELRDALRRAAEVPGTDGVRDEVARRRSRYRLRNRLTAVALAVVVIAGLGSATWVLARSFGFGSNGTAVTPPPPTAPVPSFGPVGPTTSEGSTTTPTPEVTTEPSSVPSGTSGTATTGPTSEPSTSGTSPCTEQLPSLRGDFDGDGNADTATIRHCSGDAQEWFVDIDWNGPAGSWALPECRSLCALLAAPDVDGNGTDELAVSTVAFTIHDVVIYVAPPREIGPKAVPVAPPGDPDGRFRPGDPARFAFGGDAFSAFNVRCTGSRADRRIVQTAAESLPPDSPDGVWHVHETVLRLAGSSPTTGSHPSDGMFEVVSVRDYTVPTKGPAQQHLFSDPQHFCGAPTTLP